MVRLRTQTTGPEDLPHIAELNETLFGDEGMSRWLPGQLREHLDVYPDGQFVVYMDDLLVGSASGFLVAKERALAPHTWMSITGGGDLPNHDPDGDCMYGIEIMIHPDAQGLGIAPMLYRARKVLARATGLWGIVLGGRMPGYARSVEREPGLSAEAYVRDVTAGQRTDPVLTVQVASGFRPVDVLENYTKDPASLDQAALMVWRTRSHSRRVGKGLEERPERGSGPRRREPRVVTDRHPAPVPP